VRGEQQGDGVDVPGRSLRLLVFDRVPWPRPDLLHKARRSRFGGKGYDDAIARARLSQAFGRLIRRADDRGVFVMLDAYRRQYGLRSAVVVPVNLYGPGDDFDPATSHVIPGLIRRCEEARRAGMPEMVCWGSGMATREFLHVEDAAEAVVRAAERIEDPVPINLGGGAEIAIRDLVAKVVNGCGYRGQIVWDRSKPDGQPRRSLDISRARRLLDWHPIRDFDQGLAETIQWWREQRWVLCV
jgi:dTDP-D-glucose 4,6-dehydratase